MQADASETRTDVDYAPSAETIKRIEHVRGDGLPIVSAYLAVHPLSSLNSMRGEKRLESS